MRLIKFVIQEFARFIVLALIGSSLMWLAKWFPGYIGFPEIAPIVNYIGGLCVVLCISYSVLVIIFPTIRLDDLSQVIKGNAIASAIVIFGILQIIGDIIQMSGQIMGM
nr:MAG: hypothetical protein [Bacteriophage sp.]